MPSAPARLPKKQLTGAELAALQHAFESSTLSMRDLGRRFDVSHTLVAYHVKARGWQRRVRPISRAVTKELAAWETSQGDALTASGGPLPADPSRPTSVRHNEKPDLEPTRGIADHGVSSRGGRSVSNGG